MPKGSASSASRQRTAIVAFSAEHVYAVAKEAGSAKVHWLTHRTNATARLLYDRIATETGFIQYSKAL